LYIHLDNSNHGFDQSISLTYQRSAKSTLFLSQPIDPVIN